MDRLTGNRPSVTKTPASASTIWSFDIGIASLAEAVRFEGSATFAHKSSLLIPSGLGRRGPATKSGTPASRHRMLQTRRAHERRELWLEEVWRAAGLKPLRRRSVRLVDYQIKKVKKRSGGKTRLTKKKVGGRWEVTPGDPRLEQEFGSVNGELAEPSCVLRIRLLRGETLASWQLYKAIFSAIQKRGYGDVPWKTAREVAGERAANAQEEAENAVAGQRWREFTDAIRAAGLDDIYCRACYFDAWHMKLWNPADPGRVESVPVTRPSSTRKVVFPARVIQEEVLALAAEAARQEPKLVFAYEKIMAEWRASVEARIASVNARKAAQGKKLVRIPDFSREAKDFAELLAFGPGGKAEVNDGVRAIASYDAAIRRATGLRPGGPDDAKGVLSQEVARFDNRLRASCALIPRLSVCRNLAPDEAAAIKADDHERLLPSQVTFLMKLKNMRVEESTPGRKQRGLTAKELTTIFKASNAERKYHLTKREWRKWCGELGLLPGSDAEKNAKGNDDLAVDRPRADGRGHFSRPALRILKELLLSGDSPIALHDKLAGGKLALCTRASDTLEKQLAIFPEAADKAENARNAKRGLLVSDLKFLTRMGKDGKPADDWDRLYIPSQQLDRLAQEADSPPEQRAAAIRALIGQQNNPVVRHRLETFWKRLRHLQNEAVHSGGKGFGIPRRIVLEFVRDDSESSWLGAEAASEITRAQKEQRDRRDRAKKMLTEMGQPHGNVLKYLLWEEQGGQCLYGKPAGTAINPYTENALKFSELDQYRIDHIVPRAKGGPDAFTNLVLTSDEMNSAKGDRTPWQWFKQDRTLADWDAYKNRVDSAAKLGRKKRRLLLDAAAETLVERYQPLAETAWIARLAQTIAGLHFGWTNGNDREGNKRVIVVSGGLTGRVRRKYFLNTLLGQGRELDAAISQKLDDLAARRTSSLAKEEIRARRRALRDELDALSQEIEAKKDRSDKRHHALDAMVLNFLEGWVNDPNREEEFRFALLGDNAPFPVELDREVRELRRRIIALGTAAEQAVTADKRSALQREITQCRDALGSMRMPRNERAVRETFRREIEGDEAGGIVPVRPRYLHFAKPELKATFHRGVWLRVESASRASKATIEDFERACEHEREPLVRLPFLANTLTGKKEFSPEHGRRRIAGIVPHKDYDAQTLRIAVENFLASEPTRDQWEKWCASPACLDGIKPKKDQPNLKEIVVFRIEAARTKRVSLYDLGVGSKEVDAYDAAQFELQIERLVLKPEKGKDRVDVPLEPDVELQKKLRELRPRIETFYAEHPPDPGDPPRKASARAAWQEKKERSKSAWQEFAKETGLDRFKKVYLETGAVEVTARRYEHVFLSSVLLVKVKRFDPAKAEKQAQFITDPWIRFQIREFLKRDPAPDQWREFCQTFGQISRSALADFLSGEPKTADAFIAFYRRQSETFPTHSLIRYVNQVIGSAENYVDISKDASGIYAEGGNRGYLMWKRVEKTGDEVRTTWGAKAVRSFLKLRDVKKRLLSDPGIELIDPKIWRPDMLLHLPVDTSSGAKVVPRGDYYFGSISNGRYATLKPLVGGDVFDGIKVENLLAAGLHRFPDD